MCTACVFPKGTNFTEDEFDSCWMSNQDGGGFVYLDEDEKFVIQKALKLDELKALWKEHHGKHGEHSPFLLHFRAASQGDVTLENCHPFLPNPKTAFIHNGTIYKVQSTKERSDTRVFAEEFLSKLPHNFLSNKSIMAMMDDFLGKNNKIAFLSNDGKFSITNLVDWKLHNGVHFSNDFFKNKRTRKADDDPTGYNGYYAGEHWGGQTCLPKSVTAPQTTTNNVVPISNSASMSCPGCIFTYQKHSKFWDFQKGVCVHCALEIQRMEKVLKISSWKAKELFLGAAKAHPEEEFYAKLSLLDAESPSGEGTETVLVDKDRIKEIAEDIFARNPMDVTEEEWVFLYEHGFLTNENGVAVY